MNKTEATPGSGATPLVTVSPQAPLDTGAIILRQEQWPQAQAVLASLDFASIAPADIVTIGLESEQNLGRTLDGFLGRLDKKTAAKVFDLFGRLQKGVDDANLPEILEKVQKGEDRGFFSDIVNSIFHKLTGKSAEDAAHAFMEELTELITGRTRTLATEMQKLEGELHREMQSLSGELKTLDQLKHKYGEHFAQFTVDAAVARAFVDKASAHVQAQAAAADPGDVVAQGHVRALEDKLRLLESRALALEGTYTRLPADQMVIQQVEAAGVATLQETATTLASRLASIKMALLAIQGAFAVKAVQQLSARQAKLDDQLNKVRADALKDVAVAAAKAPGDNRLAQARQIEAVIASTREIDQLVRAARQETDQKFDAARESFAQSRSALAELHAQRG